MKGFVLAAAFVAIPSASVLAQDASAPPSPLSPSIVLRLADEAVDPLEFATAVAAAVKSHPTVQAAISGQREARQARREVKSALLPSIDLGFTGDASLARDFEDRFDNIVERSRDEARANATVTGEQLLFDAGATFAKLDSAAANIDEAIAKVDASAGDVAMAAITAYLEVIKYRALVDLADEHVERHRGILQQVSERHEQGVGSLQDVARVKARLAVAQAQEAGYARGVAAAESRYLEIFAAEPGTLHRPEPFTGAAENLDQATELALEHSPIMQSALARSRASGFQYEAARAERLPSVSLAVDATKFDVFDNRPDYDVRGRLVMRYNLYSGGAGSARQAQAFQRKRQAEFDEDRARREITRDLVVAYREVEVLDVQLAVLRSAYVANEQARALYLEQFRVARGNLLDVLQAETDYFDAAATFLNGMVERDIAHYQLLATTGELLDRLGITFSFADPARLWGVND